MRNMSFAMTTEQIKNQQKLETRRFGWWFLKPGDLVQPVKKAMGLKKGERIEKIGGPIRIMATRREPLNAINTMGCLFEGFWCMEPKDFVQMIVDHYKCNPDDIVNVISFEYTEGVKE